MNRDHTAPFQKRGPRAERILQRDALALVEQECEAYVRKKMKPQLLANARQAVAEFKRDQLIYLTNQPERTYGVDA